MKFDSHHVGTSRIEFYQSCSEMLWTGWPRLCSLPLRLWAHPVPYALSTGACFPRAWRTLTFICCWGKEWWTIFHILIYIHTTVDTVLNETEGHLFAVAFNTSSWRGAYDSYALAGRTRVWITESSLLFSFEIKPYTLTLGLGSTELITEMCTRNFLGG
jgi:hypothetical protein